MTNIYDKCGGSTRFWDSVKCPFPHPLWINDGPYLGNVMSANSVSYDVAGCLIGYLSLVSIFDFDL